MTQEQRRYKLITALLAEDAAYQNVTVPVDARGQEDLLRCLMNLRPPKPIDPVLLRIQDAYLQVQCEKRGVTDGTALCVHPSYPQLVLWQGDITTLKVDAIVNAVNSALLGCFHPLHGCIDNIVHSRSGMQLRLFCHALMTKQGHEEPTGQAKITPAFNLPSRYILHTVGPIVAGQVTLEKQRQLASCYRSCLEMAVRSDCKSIAFCCISTGEFHFPNELAARIAVKTVLSFLDEKQRNLRVIFNVYKDIDRQIYQKILGA